LHAKNEQGILLRFFAISVDNTVKTADMSTTTAAAPNKQVQTVTQLILTLVRVGHDHLRTFVTAPFDAPFLRPWSGSATSLPSVRSSRSPPHVRHRSFWRSFPSPWTATKNKLTKFCLLTDIKQLVTDIKQLVQKYSISSAQVALFFFALPFSAEQTGQED
jgi:hypothetical protein